MPSSLAAELLITSTSQSSSEEETKEGMTAFVADLEPSMESLVWALGTSLGERKNEDKFTHYENTTSLSNDSIKNWKAFRIHDYRKKEKTPPNFTKIRTSTILHQRRIFESCLLITVIVQIALCQQRLCFFSSVRSWRWRSRVSIFHFNRRGLVLRHRKIVFLKIRITFLTKKKDQNYKIKAGWKRRKVKNISKLGSKYQTISWRI